MKKNILIAALLCVHTFQFLLPQQAPATPQAQREIPTLGQLAARALALTLDIPRAARDQAYLTNLLNPATLRELIVTMGNNIQAPIPNTYDISISADRSYFIHINSNEIATLWHSQELKIYIVTLILQELKKQGIKRLHIFDHNALLRILENLDPSAQANLKKIIDFSFAPIVQKRAPVPGLGLEALSNILNIKKKEETLK